MKPCHSEPSEETGRAGGALHVLCALLVALALAAQSAFADQQKSDDKELQELLSIVQQETDVATKTRINSDYVPGIVTVLEGDELEALGVRSAGEALGLVPGIQSIRDDRATESVLVRGIDFPFNVGNIQVLVNGVPLARQDSGISTSALSMPVEQIERIEVIRGPGSVIYGDFAFMGLVNIITRKQGVRGSVRYATPRQSRMLNALIGESSPAASYSFNIAHEANVTPIGTIADGHDLNDQRLFTAFNASAGGFAFTAESTHRNYVPRSATAGAPYHDTSFAADARYARDLLKTLQGEARITYLHNDENDNASAVVGRLARLATTFNWTGWKRQTWLAGADYTRSALDDAYHRPPPIPGQPPAGLLLFAHDVNRSITGAVLQDQIDVAEKFSVTLGARFDSYSDLDSRITPRASIVWRATDRHIIKAQYAEGFRPPTFFELYQPVAPNVVPQYPFEVNATTELNYIFRGNNRVGRATLFHTDIRDMLRPGGVFLTRPAHSNGIELEWGQQITPKLKVNANLTRLHTLDPRSTSGSDSDVAAPHALANVMLLYRAPMNVVLGSTWSHVGSRRGGAGFNVLSFTAGRQDVFLPGLGIRAGLRNAGDKSPVYVQVRPNGASANTTYPGRSAFMELTWKR
jgi:iron complex outermembrane receptor protein